jgi:hypothetical protein
MQTKFLLVILRTALIARLKSTIYRQLKPNKSFDSVRLLLTIRYRTLLSSILIYIHLYLVLIVAILDKLRHHHYCLSSAYSLCRKILTCSVELGLAKSLYPVFPPLAYSCLAICDLVILIVF